MYLPDVNVWLALAVPPHLHHQSARAWFDAIPNSLPCFFCRLTQQGFLRLINNPAALADCAVTQDQAWKLYDHFLAHSRVSFVDEPTGLESKWRQWTQLPRFSTKTWSDAYLAAFATAGNLELVTFDKAITQHTGVRCTILS